MAKVESKDFLERLTQAIEDENIRLGLLEDFADSFSDKDIVSETKPDYESEDNPYIAKYNDILTRYQNRFLGKDDVGNVSRETLNDSTHGNSDCHAPIKMEDIFEQKVRI